MDARWSKIGYEPQTLLGQKQLMTRLEYRSKKYKNFKLKEAVDGT